MRRLVPLALAAALALPAPAAAQPDAHAAIVAEVEAAERAFDAHTLEHGLTAGFVAYAAPDGILFRPDPVNARAHLTAGPPSDERRLRWWPGRIGAAVSGDLAFDAGPWSFGENLAHGWFFTIWKRQPDGQWRWVLDHGAGDLSGPSDIRPDTPVRVAAPGLPHPQGAAAAWTEVLAAEAALSAALRAGPAEAAYAPWLAADAWIATPDAGPVRGEAAAAAGARPAGLEIQPPAGGEASQAGDFAYAYGHAAWSGPDGAARRGHYVRVWRREADGWRLVWDQLTPIETPGA